ncbi:MAG: FAD-binding oxidoreductase [Rhodospirillaceae bacterium]|nr:FAD-binding oxidoreductase [Rhodospirillaceae bacterium]MBT5513392.1 FAD-binding oxidoreductase [Rhodospirillaceae bacterium]MBT6608682.1 FAD-binding oxidoreductase [Rhodospirillaceae bacterium]MBT7509634.1 FAD-binding oxidoreductase [Rhodospirillaceae bacterium]
MTNPTDFKETPYWWEAAPRPELPETPVAATCDVAVIGAGFAGLTAALVMARAGRDVMVFDKDRPGEGASSRNGGIASGNIKMKFADMMDQLGEDRARSIYAEGVAAREDVGRFVEAENIDCHFRLTGRFTGAYRAKHYESQAREAEFLNKHLDLGAEIVPKAEQHREIGSDLYHGGLVRPDIGGLHPGLFHQGILDRALEAGVTVHAKTSVDGIQRETDGFDVTTSRGRVKARDVLVCTNGYTGSVTPFLRKRIVPIPSQIIATEKLPPETMARLMPKGRMLGETRNTYHYFRPSPDGTGIVFGGRAGAGTDDPNVKFRHLKQGLVEVFPELRDVGITHSWWGYTAYTFDFLPKSVVNDGIHYASGFCGSGVVWARWFAMKSAHRILGNEAEAKSAFDGFDFQTRPLYTGNPWFLPMVISWYGWKDRLGL